MPMYAFSAARKNRLLVGFLTGYGWIAFIAETFRAFSSQSDKWQVIFLCTLLFMLAYPYMPNIDRQIAKAIRFFSDALGTGALIAPFFFWFLGIFMSSGRLLQSAATSLGVDHALPAILAVPLILFAAFSAGMYPAQVLARRSENENNLKTIDHEAGQ
jgi:hypothetical protein